MGSSRHVRTVEDVGFVRDVRLAGSKCTAEAGLIAHIVVPDADEATFFALQCMIKQESFTAAVAAVREADGPHPVAEAEVVRHLLHGEQGVVAALGYHRQPGARLSASDAFEPLLDALRRRGQQGRDQRLLSLDPQLPRFAAGTTRALLVLV